jgi:hypothetical protein
VASESEQHPRHLTPASAGLFFVRYGIGVIMVIAGIVLLITVPGTGVDGFAMAVGGGLAVVLINVLFRFGAEGDRERLHEEAARQFFDEHGYWPDEAPPQERQWRLPRGVVTPEQERAEREAREQRPAR